MIALFKGVGMPHISANELKTKGVAAIEAVLADHAEAIVSVRGKDRFVVMDIAHYHHLRECELMPPTPRSGCGRFVRSPPSQRSTSWQMGAGLPSQTVAPRLAGAAS
ncbi:hypothetical protein [Candidatus Skiveiella danica]|uniref:hypothetical protein n=1 Tax=Candidatus Skiveiella danica TaxID=3386177 RepID=UPI0039B93B89